MNFKSTFYTIVFSLVFQPGLFAQDYKEAAGLRMGSSVGIAFKHFVNQADAMELIAASRWEGIQVTALYERHQALGDLENLNFYYGAGGHVGAWDNYNDHPFFDERNDDRYFILGIDGILGLEYDFKEVPFVLSLDWKPELNLIGYDGFWLGDGALTIRYYW